MGPSGGRLYFSEYRIIISVHSRDTLWSYFAASVCRDVVGGDVSIQIVFPSTLRGNNGIGSAFPEGIKHLQVVSRLDPPYLM